MRMQRGSADYRRGTNELPVQRALVQHLQPGDVFYDVGSNIGFFALLAARLVGPAGSVHAFEAVPSLAADVRANAWLNRLRNVTVHPVAIGDHDGPVELLETRHPGGATIAVEDPPEDVTATITVECRALDTLLERRELPPPALVKVDVEGAEERAILGMRQLLLTHQPKLLYELDGPDPQALAAKERRTRDLLAAVGYGQVPLEPSYDPATWCVSHFLATASPMSR